MTSCDHEKHPIIPLLSPQEYGLFKVEDGVESLLDPAECPQFVKNQWLMESLEKDINSHFTLHRLAGKRGGA